MEYVGSQISRVNIQASYTYSSRIINLVGKVDELRCLQKAFTDNICHPLLMLGDTIGGTTHLNHNIMILLCQVPSHCSNLYVSYKMFHDDATYQFGFINTALAISLHSNLIMTFVGIDSDIGVEIKEHCLIAVTPHGASPYCTVLKHLQMHTKYSFLTKILAIQNQQGFLYRHNTF